MGRPRIEEFSVTVEVNPQGIVTGLRYYDQEGCGHESDTFNLTDPLDKLAMYHLNHCRRSHDVRPVVKCGFTAVVDDGSENPPKMTCLREKHGRDTKHHFEL